MPSTSIGLRVRLATVLFACLVAWGPSAARGEAELSDECRAFREDPDADLGDVLRAGCEPTTAQMSRLMDNPLGNVAMWINQVDLYSLTNDTVDRSAEYQSTYMGILQFPKKLTDNWSLINRIVYSVPSLPISQDKIDAAGGFPPFGPPAGGPTQPPSSGPPLPIDLFGGRTSGFGDMYYVGLLTPAKGISHGPGRNTLWGIGLDMGFPTATEDILGGGKWTMGPSALAVYMGRKWKVGGLLQQYFSYAGDDDRDDVSLMNFQYFVYYSLSDTMSIGAGPNIIANWEATSGERWTLPVGLGINKTFQLGKLPVRFGVEFHYSAVRPDSVGADWDLRFFVIPAMPAALFKWMQ
jgi:hypothetical protein